MRDIRTLDLNLLKAFDALMDEKALLKRKQAVNYSACHERYFCLVTGEF